MDAVFLLGLLGSDLDDDKSKWMADLDLPLPLLLSFLLPPSSFAVGEFGVRKALLTFSHCEFG